MAKGGPELLEDPVARELLASRIPVRLAELDRRHTAGRSAVVPLGWHGRGGGDPAGSTETQGAAHR